MQNRAPAQPRNWLSALLSLCLRGVGRGLWYSLWGTALFIFAAWAFHRTLLTLPDGETVISLPILMVIYALFGFVCGATIGVTSAVMDHTRELAVSLQAPLDRIAQHVHERIARGAPRQVEETRSVLTAELGTLVLPLHARVREFGFGKVWEAVLEYKLLRSLLGGDNLLYEVMRQGQDPASSGKTVERFLREKLVDLAADDIHSRFQFAQYLNYAVVLALLLVPPLVMYVVRQRALSP